MAQLELANRMRLQRSAAGKAPIAPAPPRGGFGSAQGILHLKRGDFGKKLQAPPISPFDRTGEAESGAVTPSTSEEILEVPAEAEVRKENPKGPRRPRKRFKNPKLP